MTRSYVASPSASFSFPARCEFPFVYILTLANITPQEKSDPSDAVAGDEGHALLHVLAREVKTPLLNFKELIEPALNFKEPN